MMTSIKDMNIVLLDLNSTITEAWKKNFAEYDKVAVVRGDLLSFLNTPMGKDIDCIVSPANAYGLMDGGLDKAISNYYEGHSIDIGREVRYLIRNYYHGEQPVTSALYVSFACAPDLIHCPTMRTPMRIDDPMIVYYCMRNTLMCAEDNNVKTILIPAFGGATGGVNPETISRLMLAAYKQLIEECGEGWGYARSQKIVL